MTELQFEDCIVMLINTHSVFHLWSRSSVSAESVQKYEVLIIILVLGISNVVAL